MIGAHLKPLRPEDAVQINSVWPHRREGSVEYIERIIRNDYTMGIYAENGELMAWCLRNHMGSLGTLQVKDEFQRRGYGILLIREMARLCAINGYDVTGSVMPDNFKSIKLVEKVGFRKIDENFSFVFKKNYSKCKL